jgi:hypothetical protein
MKNTFEYFSTTPPRYQPFTLDILIPNGKSFRHLLPGSGIVANPTPKANNMKDVYFEGNKHGAVNLGTYEERLFNAADRLWGNYPTVAAMLLDEKYFSEFSIVGSLSMFSVPTKETFDPRFPFMTTMNCDGKIVPYQEGLITTVVFDYTDEYSDLLHAYIASYRSAR